MYPSTKTFGIPELLEMILEHAIPQDVLLWQRVNKTWHAVIQTSTSLQEKLYFTTRLRQNENEQHDAVWNPFTEFLFARNYSPNVCCLPIANDAFSGKATHPTASWRRMMTTSPAATWILARKFTCGYTIWDRATLVTCGSGITIGKLAETLEGGSFYDRRNANGKLAGFARKFDHPSDDCHTCSLLGDPRVCSKAANIA